MYFISWKIVNFYANNKISKKIDFKHNEKIKEKKYKWFIQDMIVVKNFWKILLKLLKDKI